MKLAKIERYLAVVVIAENDMVDELAELDVVHVRWE